MKDTTDKTSALTRTKCECKAKFFGDKCEVDCSGGGKYAGTFANKKCTCSTDYFRANDKDATDCANTCSAAGTKVNAGKTACECKADYLGDPKDKCVACKTADSEVKCACDKGWSGDDCSKESSGNGFV